MKSDAKQTQIVIKKFTQDACRPCQVLSYALDAEQAELAEAGAIIEEIKLEEVGKEIFDQYGIMSTPTLVFERNGMKMTELRGMINIREVFDAVEYSKTAR